MYEGCKGFVYFLNLASHESCLSCPQSSPNKAPAEEPPAEDPLHHPKIVCSTAWFEKTINVKLLIKVSGKFEIVD